jgi:hypothetical protein
MKSFFASVIAAAVLITSLALSSFLNYPKYSSCIRQATTVLLADRSDPMFPPPPPPPPPTSTDGAA